MRSIAILCVLLVATSAHAQRRTPRPRVPAPAPPASRVIAVDADGKPVVANDLAITLTCHIGDVYLWADVSLENTTRTRKIDFLGFTAIDALGQWCHKQRPRLHDNHGNDYSISKPSLFHSDAGQLGQVSIHPGKMVINRVFFERPIDAADYLILVLPGDAALDTNRNVRFKIELKEKPKPAPKAPEPAGPLACTPADLVKLKKVGGEAVMLTGTAEARFLGGKVYLRFKDRRGSLLVSATLDAVPAAMADKVTATASTWTVTLSGTARRQDGVVILSRPAVAEASPTR